MTKTTPGEQANPFGELTKMFEQFKVPGVDMGAIVESRRKDMEALIATNQATLESMQGIARKQAEILAQAFKSVQDGMQTMVKGGLSAPDPAKSTEMARKTYETAVAEMSELAEMARRAQADAMAGITARAQQSVQQIQQLMQPK